MRRRVQAELNKGEVHNAQSRAVFMHRLGVLEIGSIIFEIQTNPVWR
ncbi:Tn3 family transposase [Escherichia coli]|nr:transposase [Escherichia coli]EFE5943637.1 transposase [Escherichia coli]EII2919748.1 Tn3 family transposase [Escherichia coli]EJT6703059.1 Tn3 family transposase [Escherichia coli]EKJ3251443.1 Tn3 family transposase [Escherichia coli]